MCGISGIINKNNCKVIEKDLKSITNIIIHRGPDGEGYYYGDNFGFGHRRLAIIDLSDNANQPMEYMDKYVISYNGEIYNYIELKQMLMLEGYLFNTNSDTEVILAAYDKWGWDCLNHFNGMWAFSLYDKVKNIVFCARDRFGIKPLYYIETEKKFVFASEIKQFTQLEEWKPVMNKGRAYDFLVDGIFDHSEETLFEDVYQISPGQYMVYDLEKHLYAFQQWYMIDENINKYDNEHVKSKDYLYRLLEDSIKLRMRSDVKLGACLSGGLDSSSIVAIVDKLLNEQFIEKQNIQTVSSCSEIKKYDEQEYIDYVIDSTSAISHKVYPKYNELFQSLDKIIWHQDEPFGSTSIFAQYNVFDEAGKNKIKVMLDGQGADETLLGYHGFFATYFVQLFKGIKYNSLYKEVKAYKSLHSVSNRALLKKMQKRITPKVLVSILRKRFVESSYPWIKESEEFGSEYITEINKKAYKSLISESITLIKKTSLPMLLHYEDRNSMLSSIESRVPFLDYRLVEFIMSLEDNQKLYRGKTKHILREAMKKNLTDKVVNRIDKMGFVTPEEVWIRENKEVFMKEAEECCNLLDKYIDVSMAMKWLEDLFKNGKAINSIVWRLVCLGRWIKIFNVKV